MGLGKISDMISWEFSDLVKFPNEENNSKQEEDMMKDEMSKDYDNGDSSEKSHYRPTNHLVLCVHGIGQNLGKKYQYVNFAHTVNLLRNNIKYLYKSNPSLQEFNSARKFPDYKTNSGTQVLPITWRHAIGFNTDETNTNRDNEDLPTLADLTVDGIRPLRKLLGDVGLDILLYGDDFYLDRILKHVTNELNDVYAVSYTHLDVYKRQLFSSSHLIADFSFVCEFLLSWCGSFSGLFENEIFRKKNYNSTYTEMSFQKYHYLILNQEGLRSITLTL